MTRRATYKPVYTDRFLKRLIERQRGEEQDGLDYVVERFNTAELSDERLRNLPSSKYGTHVAR
jgi:hypothetical protein